MTLTVEINGHREPPPLSKEAQIIDNRVFALPDVDPSKLGVQLSDEPKNLPATDGLVFGATMSDHMLIMSFDPTTGWSAPEIRPYGPLSLDPASSVFQYCSVAFEGMKAYLDPDGSPRLFRPTLNMARFARSAERAALPAFGTSAVLELIKKLVRVDKRWIPNKRGYSLYIRPTIIGTRPALGVAASSHAILYCILSPTGPYFPGGIKPISILASCDTVTPLTSLNPDGNPPARSWPGGTGEFKLGINYAPTFEPQKEAARRGYEQILWVLDEPGEGKERRITEMGQMNFFMVVAKDDHDGELDLVTPRLDGTILPGVTRDSVIALAKSHSISAPLHSAVAAVKSLNVVEETVYMSTLVRLLSEGKVLEVFGAATAAVISPIGKIGYQGTDWLIPTYDGGLGPVGRAMFEKITDIQEGMMDWEDWSVLC